MIMENVAICFFVILLVVMAVTCKGGCPVWTTYNSSSQQCECGDELRGIVHCDPDTFKVRLQKCYCMTYNEDINIAVVGGCVLTCGKYGAFKEAENTDDILELDKKMRAPFKRTGQLCGKCVDNYSLPVYSYSQECTRCSRSDFKYNLLKYVCIAFLPLTVFYFIVILFKISITSGHMVGYIFVCQIVSSPTIVRSHLAKYSQTTQIFNFVISCFMVWNLDFFRALYSPFCIHPEMIAMQVLTLDYLVAVYPLLLIFLTYIAVSLHDRYPIVVKMWRPAYRVFRCIRREWNIRGSLVQAFASFLVLSYVKILNVSFDLLRFVRLYDVKGEVLNQTYFYSNAEIVYFGHEHLPYGVLAIAMFVIFNILPMILLFLYPCRCFQRCLNRCGVRSQLLHTFMDAFQGCYRHQPRDCRHFAGIYLYARMQILAITFIVENRIVLMIGSGFIIILAMALLLKEPYKMHAHNKLDSFFFLLVALITSFRITDGRNSMMLLIMRSAWAMSVITFFLYGCVAILSKIIPEKTLSYIKNLRQRITIIFREKV